ncbi:hypothetical protein [Teredinibacter waterburyi]|jgi:hypothetical protein|uniref:hypothetical protein n=1 Tax=Teredinibacter waterburyi TaxID=1500538 RepID=UPI00165FBD64|nr:hypothetical protein [Teredinibacter waterburyi]
MGDNDSRRLPRVAVQQIVVVFDAMLDQELGRIVNLNQEGFMLIGDSVKENCLYQLNFFLSEPIGDVSTLSIGAECLWVRETVGDDRNWAGFHILDIADADLKVIDELISQIDDN